MDELCFITVIPFYFNILEGGVSEMGMLMVQRVSMD